MGNNDINLTRPLKSNAQRIKILRLISLGGLFFVSFLAILFFILGRIYSVSSVQKQQEEVLSKFTLIKEKQGKAILVNDRLININRTLSTRSDYRKNLEEVTVNFPENLTINAANITSQEMSLTVSSRSLSPLSEFVNRFIVMAGRKEIKRLVIESLSYNDQSSLYILSLGIENEKKP